MTLEERARTIPGVVGFSGLVTDADWQFVTVYPRQSEFREGTEVQVYVHRMPAMFWKIVIPAWEMAFTTGSDMHDLVDRMAQAIQGGMLGIEQVADARSVLSEMNPNGRAY